MKSQHTSDIPTLVLSMEELSNRLEPFVPSSPKMRQIVSDYEASHSQMSGLNESESERPKLH